MKTPQLWCICVIGLVASEPCFATSRNAKPHAEPDGVVAFVNVHVVPMDAERLVAGQTVIVRQENIIQIGPTETTPVPPDAVRVDGTDKYLMPGLVDMHVHILHPNALRLFIANGVTTVRNMSGSRRHLLWRRQLARGALLGPTLYTAGPVVNGTHRSRRWGKRTFAVVETAAEAEQVVAQQKKAGYDFIKVYDHLTPEAYRGVMAAAQHHGMPVVGHVPWAVGLPGVLAAGQVSRPIWHRTVEEIWYVLEGHGRVWRCPSGYEPGAVGPVPVVPGDALTIPTGWRFQFSAGANGPLRFLCYTSPPWPGPGEAQPAERGGLGEGTV